MTVLDLQTCRRLILFGGTFDPPHLAHVRLPFIAAKHVDADGVLYIPAGQPPHKTAGSATPAHHRLNMLRLAIGDRHDAAVCTDELDRTGPSYTVTTLHGLRESLGPDVAMHLLIGADMALIFEQWRDPDVIEQLAEPLVMIRPPHDREALLSQLPVAKRSRWADRIVEVPAMDISSSAIRQAIAADRMDEVEPMLHVAVADYIKTHRLYRR